MFLLWFFDITFYNFGAFVFDVSVVCDVCVAVAWIVQYTFFLKMCGLMFVDFDASLIKFSAYMLIIFR